MLHVYMYVQNSTTSKSDQERVVVVAMSILNYSKPKDSLPDLKGPLSQSLSSQLISAANSTVTKVIDGSASKKCAEYNK